MPPPDSSSDAKDGAAGKGKGAQWSRGREPVKQRFPITDPGAVALRVAMDKEAFADLIQHAKESLAAEVCGVVVGRICRDDHGLWVDVSGTVRGHAASGGSSHVTFTQETWTAIHAEKERRFPASEIVGWYHSHPGFGVEFSEMDIFVHRNFFPGEAQIAILTDPINGEDAICMNDADGVRYLERMWIDSRERKLTLPGSKAQAGSENGAQTRVDALEARVAQMVGTLDEMRDRIWSFYLSVGMIVVMLVVGWMGLQIYRMYANRYEPPEVMSEVSIPIKVGDKNVMMLARIYGWEVPPGLNSLLIQQLELAREREEKAREDARKAAEAAKAAGEAEPTESPTGGGKQVP